jgi:hypothetical protein
MKYNHVADDGAVTESRTLWWPPTGTRTSRYSQDARSACASMRSLSRTGGQSDCVVCQVAYAAYLAS